MTTARYYERDVRRLEILKALIIQCEDPEINKQDTGKCRVLKLYGTVMQLCAAGPHVRTAKESGEPCATHRATVFARRQQHKEQHMGIFLMSMVSHLFRVQQILADLVCFCSNNLVKTAVPEDGNTPGGLVLTTIVE